MSIVLSAAALSVALVSALFAFLAARAASRSADAAESSDRRTRTPLLAILLDDPSPAPIDRVIYRVRNDGPQGLDAVVVHRPRPSDRITYRIAVTGGSTGWADDEINLGPLAMTQEARFTLCCGSAPDLPEFRVLIECRSGTDEWSVTSLLPCPRGPTTA